MFNLSKTLKRIVSVSAAAVCLITGVHFTPDSEKVTADAASGMAATATQVSEPKPRGAIRKPQRS